MNARNEFARRRIPAGDRAAGYVVVFLLGVVGALALVHWWST